LIFLQEPMYHLGTPASSISCSAPSGRPLPFRTASMILDNDAELVTETLCLDRTKEDLLGAIDANNQADLLAMEISLAEVLASMEQDGFLVDADGLKVYGEEINKRVKEMTARIYDEVGFEFNLNSPKQLGEALFEKLGLPGGKKTKTGWSTNAAVLEELADEYKVVADILEYRTVSKLKSTYCDGLVKVIAEDGRIHSTLNQTETRTGRISSSEPNLQNIPVRKPIGSELRKFFVARPGYTLVDADYSQIELRVLASVANDENMIAAFKSGEDIHAITASQVFGVPLDYVTPLMRSNAKAVNFGIVYGIGAFSLSKQLGITRKEADNYIKGYLHNFSGVDAYMHNVVEQAKKDGYVKTLYERRRYLPELTASNRNLRAFGERVAMNMPIQGTAADIIKIAMIKVYNRLAMENLDAKLIMQVHDELIVECEESIADKVLDIVTFEMEHAVALAVDMQVDAHIGKTWYEAKG
ncbi:MAG: DNA polymerase I, partial [Clostridia bacterium]|nr:DNA polymerase I [Clostridia bacterium]